MALFLRALTHMYQQAFNPGQFQHISPKILAFRRSLCNLSKPEPNSPSNRLITKLIQAQISGIKSVLESDEEPTKDPFFWDALVTALQSSFPDKALQALEWKLERLLKEEDQDQTHYSELIHLCGKIQKIPFAMEVFTSMETQGIKPNSTLFNSLIQACLCSGHVITALSLFEIMDTSDDSKPSLATYNLFVSNYSKLGDAKTMQAWLLALKKSGFSPDVHTFQFLIGGYVKGGMFHDANRCYYEMDSVGIAPNLPILESMLDGLCKQKRLNDVKKLLKVMEDRRWDITEVMANMLLRLYFEMERIDEMEELLNLVKCNSNLSVLRCVHIGIIRMYSMLDQLDDLEFSIGRMLKKGFIFEFKQDVEGVICSYFRREAYERLDLFLDRIRGLYKFEKSTYHLLVAGYRRAGLTERLELLLRDMKKSEPIVQ